MEFVKEKREFYSQFFHPQSDGEVMSPESQTEQVYIPLKDQIEEMMLSGRMLEAYRHELYHFGPDEAVDEAFEDPTLHPSYDAADAAIDRARLLGKRNRVLREERLKREAELAAEAAAGAAASGSDAASGSPEPGK